MNSKNTGPSSGSEKIGLTLGVITQFVRRATNPDIRDVSEFYGKGARRWNFQNHYSTLCASGGVESQARARTQRFCEPELKKLIPLLFRCGLESGADD